LTAEAIDGQLQRESRSSLVRHDATIEAREKT
jgi:hypothetical protein